MTIYGVHSSSFKRFLNGVSESVVGKFLSRDLDAIAFMQEMERVTISLGVGGGSAHSSRVCACSGLSFRGKVRVGSGPLDVQLCICGR